MNVIRFVLWLAFLGQFVPLSAQAQPGNYRIWLTDKMNSPFSLTQPGAYLSQRAIDRRNVQNIAVTTHDLPVNPAYLAAIEGTGAVLLTQSKWLNTVVVQLDDTLILQQLAGLPFVMSMEWIGPAAKSHGGPGKGWPDKWEIQAGLTENAGDVSGSALAAKGTMFDYGASLNQISMINGDILHARGFRGEGMVIAVLDAGFFRADSLPVFDSLRFHGRILGTRDFPEPGGNVYQKSSHGTAVLSIMGGNLPGELVGTAPQASYWLLRSEDANSEYPVEEDYWVAAAEFADSAGADIINSSLGYTVFFDSSLDHTYAQMDGNTTVVTRGADMAASRGMLVVNSAGNWGGSFWQYIGAPADGDSVLTIGAVNAVGQLVSFSSTGPTFDGRIKPSVMAQGSGTIVAGSSGGVFPGNGTSFSSPVMAGAAACLWQAHPQCTAMEIYQAILESADRYQNPDNFFGYGIPDMAEADLGLYTPPQSLPGMPVFLFPNPSRLDLRVHFYLNDYRNISLQLYDLSGRQIGGQSDLQGKPGANVIDVHGADALPAGLYLLEYRSGEAQVMLKWLKM
ncbi:MAG TPA: S8 family serine peptidase [Bacteroidales bacterium]|nr:S8 family serine peptidase [Bacteroidales bacterium]HSA42528.1 S8 family serine peptidase [Bacteroidales bacterium]